MNNLMIWLTVVGVGILELWGAIPLGFTLGLHPVLTAVLSAIGSILGAVIIIFFGSSLRNWLIQRTQRGGKGRGGRMATIWNKYGIIGIGFLSPLLTGAPLGAAIGISLGADPRKLFIWMTIGIIFWSAVLTGIAAFGVNALNLGK